MKTSKDRILTTHTGSLPRPKPLIDFDADVRHYDVIEDVSA